jgi:hypothetical protein
LNVQVEENEIGRNCNTHGEEKNAYRVLVGYPEGNRPLGDLYVEGDTVKKDRREIIWGDMDWIVLTHDRDQWRAPVNMIMNLRVP